MITIIIIDDKEESQPKRTPPNKGKKLEELYTPDKVKRIRRKISKAQLRRYGKL